MKTPSKITFDELADIAALAGSEAGRQAKAAGIEVAAHASRARSKNENAGKPTVSHGGVARSFGPKTTSGFNKNTE